MILGGNFPGDRRAREPKTSLRAGGFCTAHPYGARQGLLRYKMETSLNDRLAFLAATMFVGAWLAFLSPSAMACNGNGNCDEAPGHNKAAPVPVAGAGIPVLLIAGGYWIVRRYRRSRDKNSGPQ
jgi:hypothetical protein